MIGGLVYKVGFFSGLIDFFFDSTVRVSSMGGRLFLSFVGFANIGNECEL